MKRWIQKHSIFITLIPVIALMAMIYCFSAQTGESSGALSGRITTWVLSVFVPHFQQLPLDRQESLRYAVGTIIRKGAHFSEYALLGFFLMLHIQQLRKRIKVRLPWLWAWSVSTVYAVTDELHQGFVGGRHPAVTDVLIDSSGVLTGVLLLLGLLCWQKRRKMKKTHRSASQET